MRIRDEELEKRKRGQILERNCRRIKTGPKIVIREILG